MERNGASPEAAQVMMNEINRRKQSSKVAKTTERIQIMLKLAETKKL